MAPGQLPEYLEQIRRDGFAIEDGEYKIGLRAVSAPAYDQQGRCNCAIGAVGLFRRGSSLEFQEAVTKTVRAARKLSLAGGCQPNIPARG